MIYYSNWPWLANLDTLRKAWTVFIIHHVQLILVISRRTRTEYYANKFSTLIPIRPLGLIVHGLCFLVVNVFAIECIYISSLPTTATVTKLLFLSQQNHQHSLLLKSVAIQQTVQYLPQIGLETSSLNCDTLCKLQNKMD